MNINDLQPGSFTVTKQGTGAPVPTNVSQLQPGSFQVTPPAAPQAPSLGDRLLSTAKETAGNIGNRIQQGAQALDDSASGKTSAPEAGLRIFGSVLGVGNDLFGGAVKAGLQTADAATGGALKSAATSGIQAIAQTPVGAMGLSAIKNGMQSWEDFSAKYPRAAQDLSVVPEVAQMLANFVGGGAAIKGTEAAAPLIKTATTAAIDTAKAGTKSLAERSTAKALQQTVEAVTPELKGKALTSAYKDVVTGTRDIKPGKVLARQAVTASPREQDVGKRLFQAGIQLGKNPTKNLTTLRSALQTTETKLEDVLKGDPEMVFNADKPTLITTLDKLSTNMPEEFKAIKDSGAVFDRVVNYGKKLVAKTSDDVQGLRNARSAFDAQAKIEFPSAFNGEGVDLKTPAGRAIKAVRDSINDHLYETAPEGSEIKRLIGVESDIFRARDAIAPRAASGHGTSLVEKGLKYAKDHPAGSLFVGYEAAKHTIAPGLPGL